MTESGGGNEASNIVRTVQKANAPDLSPKEGLSLRHNFSWTFVGNIIYGASQWAMIIAIARFGSPVMVGEFALAVAFVTPIFALTNLQLRSIQATDASNLYDFGHYLGLRILSTFGGIICIIGGVLFAGYTLWIALIILSMGLAKAIENISDVFYGLQQQHERMDAVATSKIVRGPLSLLGLSVTIWATQSIAWGIVAIAVCRLLVLMTVDIPIGRYRLRDLQDNPTIKGPKPIFDRRTLMQLAWLAFPMGLVTMFISITTNIPRLILESASDTYTLGLFAAIASLMAVGEQVNTALGQSAAPRLARLYERRYIREHRILALKLISVGVLLGIVGIAAAAGLGRLLLSMIYSPEYADYANVFVIIMIAALCAYVSSALGYTLTSLRRFWYQTSVSVATMAITVIASLVLIPPYGIEGAAWTIVVAFTIQIPLKVIAIVRITGISIMRPAHV